MNKPWQPYARHILDAIAKIQRIQARGDLTQDEVLYDAALRNLQTLSLGLASKLIHILERRSIPPSCVVRRLNRLAIRTPLALLDGHLDDQKCELFSTQALSNAVVAGGKEDSLPDYPVA
jgi:hypothetical protein